jgi:Aspartyl protease
MSVLRLAFCGLTWLVVGSPCIIAATDTSTSTIYFNSRADSLIILPVRVNGAGPYEFLMDTGTSETVVDSELADRLKLPITGSNAAATLRSSTFLLTAHATKLEMVNAMVEDLDLLVVPKSGILSHYPGVRGILGEDFCETSISCWTTVTTYCNCNKGPRPWVKRLLGNMSP